MKELVFALDLKPDRDAIYEYEQWHKKVWPEILQSIHQSGIQKMEIFRSGNRLVMIMKTTEDFSLEAKASADASNPKVQEWEALMSHFQQPLPWAQLGEKWLLMNSIFSTEVEHAAH